MQTTCKCVLLQVCATGKLFGTVLLVADRYEGTYSRAKLLYSRTAYVKYVGMYMLGVVGECRAAS